MREIAFVDCETSGFDPAANEVLEVAVVRLEPMTFRILGTLHAYVMPECPVSDEVAEINGYDEDLWRARGAKPFGQIADSLTDALRGAQMGGQNVPFDNGFLRGAYNRCGLPFPKMDYHTVDLMSLAHPLVLAGLLPGVGLQHQMRFFGLGEQRHTALDDVLAEVEIYKRYMSLFVDHARLQADGCADAGRAACVHCNEHYEHVSRRWPYHPCSVCGGGGVTFPRRER